MSSSLADKRNGTDTNEQDSAVGAKCKDLSCGHSLRESNDLAKNVSLLTNEIKDPKNIQSNAFGMRHVQSILLFLDIVAIYISRWNVSVALVAMTKHQATSTNYPEFHWNESQTSYIRSSLFCGYVVTQFPGGVLCKRYGVKIVMGLATFSEAVLSALTPCCVGWGDWQAFCVIRFMQGLAQGMLFPCVFAHLAKWAPVKERNRLGAISLAGLDCGIVLAMSISGVIADGPLGWAGIYYVSAGICFSWCVFWMVFGANNACESKFIKEAEKHYIESSLAHEDDFHQKKIPVPWKAALTSVPFIASLIARCAQFWGMSTVAAQIPSYFNGVLNMKIQANAIFSALPFLATWIMTYVYMVLADTFQRKNLLSLTSVRKIFNSIAFWLPAMGMIGVGFLDEDYKALALSIMIISMGANSGEIIGSSLNILDLSPTHAGVLYSIINSVSSFMPLISPLVVGVIVTDVHNRSQWQIVFAISAVVLFLGNLLYLIFGSTETQPWDAEDYMLPKDTERSSRDYENIASDQEINVNGTHFRKIRLDSQEKK